MGIYSRVERASAHTCASHARISSLRAGALGLALRPRGPERVSGLCGPHVAAVIVQSALAPLLRYTPSLSLSRTLRRRHAPPYLLYLPLFALSLCALCSSVCIYMRGAHSSARSTRVCTLVCLFVLCCCCCCFAFSASFLRFRCPRARARVVWYSSVYAILADERFLRRQSILRVRILVLDLWWLLSGGSAGRFCFRWGGILFILVWKILFEVPKIFGARGNFIDLVNTASNFKSISFKLK